jgi:hypothetical protein
VELVVRARPFSATRSDTQQKGHPARLEDAALRVPKRPALAFEHEPTGDVLVANGWDKRPFLGFNGGANGTADNWRSSCLSCHAAARVPRSSKGLLDFRFDVENLSDSAAVREHVDIWFQNLESGALFDPGEPAVASLDYSLQLDAATFRMCRACNSPFMSGPTPRLCIDSGFFAQPTCSGGAITTMRADLPFRAESEAALPPPPRQ